MQKIVTNSNITYYIQLSFEHFSMEYNSTIEANKCIEVKII